MIEHFAEPEQIEIVNRRFKKMDQNYNGKVSQKELEVTINCTESI